ncbi:MAG: alpha/beta hydrolase [Betaproteobacteria bacterium RIFCSPLOWO2_02_FULL_62_17]|nr:MAG: alpha/beta hydrolase [Betaproteobacteria bacterium RIFCSPLOWO2_02_FULL_62_17]
MSQIPVVLIPGLLCDSLLWAPQIGTLSDIADCWVASPTGADSIESLAAQLLERAPFPQFSLAGLSMGGYVALEIMRQAPGRVLKLALLDTSARADTPEQTERRHALIEIARRGRFAEVTNLLLPALVNRARSYDRQIVGTIRAMARNVGEEAFYRQESAIIRRIDSRPHLEAIRCPTLVLCGHQDAITPPPLHRELASGINGAKLVLIGDCGHLSTIEQPEEVNLALRAWLTD